MNYNPLVLNNGIPSTLPLSGSSVFAAFTSSAVSTRDTGVSSATFTTPSNSPAFTFVPTVSGNYKVYASVPLYSTTTGSVGEVRIFNTSANATLLSESQACGYSTGGDSVALFSVFCQSVYALTAGISYTFDFQTLTQTGTVFVAGDEATFYMFAEGIALSTLPLSGSSVFAAYASSQVTTLSAAITSSSFETFSNSPAFTITPTVSGNYKVYCSIPVETDGSESFGVMRIFNTSANATLLYESQGMEEAPGEVNLTGGSAYIQSVYTLVAGTSYQFDIQGLCLQGGSLYCLGEAANFYMFAEGIALSTLGGGSNTFISSQVTTRSSDITSTSFVNFDNSPAFTLVPNITGNYKVYSSVPIIDDAQSYTNTIRVVNTSGSAVLVAESQAYFYDNTSEPGVSVSIQSIYTLTAGVSYVFDIQGKTQSGGAFAIAGDIANFYMFTELLP